MRRVGLVLLLLFAACTLRQPIPADLAITDVTVITMASELPLPRRTVIIRDGKIAQILQATGADVNAARVIDGRGKFLMPGLIDVHVHLTTDDAAANQQMLEALLRHGVTTALALNGRESHLRLRDEIAAGKRRGPRLLVSTRNVNREDLTREGGEALARDAKSAGYDFIKIYDQISPDGFAGIAAVAGIPLVGHVPKKVGLERSIRQGLRRIAHAEELLYNEPFHYRTSDVPLSVLDETKIPDVVKLLKDNGVMLSPTLIAYQTIINASENPPTPDDFYAKKFTTPLLRARLRAAFEFQKKLVMALHGGRILLAAGTDTPMLGHMQAGEALHNEIAIYHEIGMTNFEALTTATRDAAKFLDLDRVLGTIEPGKSADLILLRSDPLRDISAVRTIDTVVARGVVQ